MQKGCQGKNDTRETVVRAAVKNFVMRLRLLTLSSVDSSKESKARRRNPATECSAATYQQAESRHQWERTRPHG